MLLAFVIIAIYIAILKVIENPIIKKIQEGNDLNEVLYQRHRLINVRKISLAIVFIICIALHIIQKYAFDLEWFDMDLIKATVLSIFFCFIVVRQRKEHNPLGVMSDLSKDDVINAGNDYILFLRGFEQDDYTPKAKMNKWKRRFKRFSEFYFTSILKKSINVYAVGMTKEIEAPTGAERVYLSDKNWKQDVLDLMINARLIIVLVDDRESCIWEIERSIDMLSKTLFIVDDMEKYSHIQMNIGDKVAFPQMSNNTEVPFMISLKKNTKPLLYKFYNTKKSYRKITDIISKRHLNGEYKQPFIRTTIGKCLVYLGVFITSTILSSLLSGILGDGYNNVYFFFGSLVVILTLGVYICKRNVFN